MQLHRSCSRPPEHGPLGALCYNKGNKCTRKQKNCTICAIHTGSRQEPTILMKQPSSLVHMIQTIFGKEGPTFCPRLFSLAFSSKRKTIMLQKGRSDVSYRKGTNREGSTGLLAHHGVDEASLGFGRTIPTHIKEDIDSLRCGRNQKNHGSTAHVLNN